VSCIMPAMRNVAECGWVVQGEPCYGRPRCAVSPRDPAFRHESRPRRGSTPLEAPGRGSARVPLGAKRIAVPTEGPPTSDTRDDYEIYVHLRRIDPASRTALGPYVPPKTAAESAIAERDARTAEDHSESLSQALQRRGVHQVRSTSPPVSESSHRRFRLRRKRRLLEHFARYALLVLIVTAMALAGLYFGQFR
jgi:hypothetical protein